MQLYFIRHAQSENNLLFDLNGNENERKPDPSITTTGWEQARILADFIKKSNNGNDQNNQSDSYNRQGFNFTHLYCSLMVRSIQTGFVLAKTLELPIAALSDLHEGGGIFIKDEDSDAITPLPGNNLVYFRKNFPGLTLPEDINPEGWWNRPFESYLDRSKRADRLLELLLDRHFSHDHKIALISHAGFYNYFLGAVLGCCSEPYDGETLRLPKAWLTLNNTAITRIDWSDHGARLVYHNRVDFLPTQLIT